MLDRKGLSGLRTALANAPHGATSDEQFGKIINYAAKSGFDQIDPQAFLAYPLR